MLAATSPERKAGTFSGDSSARPIWATTSLPSLLLTQLCKYKGSVIQHQNSVAFYMNIAEETFNYLNILLKIRSCLFNITWMAAAQSMKSGVVFASAALFIELLGKRTASCPQVKRRREYKQIYTFSCFRYFHHEVINVFAQNVTSLNTKTEEEQNCASKAFILKTEVKI